MQAAGLVGWAHVQLCSWSWEASPDRAPHEVKRQGDASNTVPRREEHRHFA